MTAFNSLPNIPTEPALCRRGIPTNAAFVLGILLALSAAEAAKTRIAIVQAPVSSSRPAGLEIGESIARDWYLLGTRIAVAEMNDIAGTLEPVTTGFACATDPVFSHDGTRLAFTGQREPNGFLQIWEIGSNATEARQVFSWNADCVHPALMPNRNVVFASLGSHEYEEHGGTLSLSLYEWAPGSGTPSRLTFNPSSDFDPVVLADGRLLYSSWQHVGNHHWPRGTVALMLINSDGTGLFPLTGNHRGPWLKRGARPFDADRVAFIQSDGSSPFGAGALMATSLNDAFAPYASLVTQDEFEVSAAAPLADGGFVISARPKNGSRPTFGIYALRNGRTELLYDDPEYHDLSPVVALVGTPPDYRVSTVVPHTPFGYLLVLNCTETDRLPKRKLQTGSVSAVRVIEGLPIRHDGRNGPEFVSVPDRDGEPLIRPNSATGYIPARILGEVPPASDGSVYLKVPSDRPLRLQLIDQDGFVAIDERAWFWVRPNERRVCIGCHENRELSPHNAVPLAVRRAPTDLTNPNDWQTVSFRNDIQPILSQNCAVSGCHMPPSPTAGLNMSANQFNGARDELLADRFTPAYANLLARREDKPASVGGRRVHPGDARNSPLMWMLYGRQLGEQYAPAPFDRPLISPHPGPMLPQAQLELFRKWIELGAQYDDFAPSGPWPHEISIADTREAQQ